MATTSKGGLELKLSNMLNGVEGMGDKVTVSLNQKQVSGTALAKQLQDALAPYQAVDAARADLKLKMATRKSGEAGAQATFNSIQAAIMAFYGNDPNALAQFGLAPNKPKRQLTTEEKLQKKVKAKQTRALRGTLGKRAKGQVKALGSVSINTSLNGVPTAASSSPVNGLSSASSSGAAWVSTVATPAAPSTSASTAAPQPAASNGVSNGVVAPMVMNGAGH